MKQVILLLAVTSQWAFAEAAPQAPAAAGGLGPFIPMIIMFGIIYFLMIRPQQKKAKVHQQFLTNLKRGDMVVTQSGIIGTVKTVSDKIVTIEIDEGVCVKVLRQQIADNASKINTDPKFALSEKKDTGPAVS
jgi:preprotein translocase subunit YajC